MSHTHNSDPFSGLIIKYDGATGKEIARKREHKNRINRITFNADKTLFITACKDCDAKLFDPYTLDVIKVFRTDRPVNGAVISPTHPHVRITYCIYYTMLHILYYSSTLSYILCTPYIYTYIYTYTYIFLYIHLIHIHLCIRYTYTYIYLYTYTYIYLYIHLYIPTHTPSLIHPIYTLLHIHLYIHPTHTPYTHRYFWVAGRRP